MSGALSAVDGREAAAITFVVAASGLTFLGIGAAFWALVAGLLVRAVLPRAGQTVQAAAASPPASPAATPAAVTAAGTAE